LRVFDVGNPSQISEIGRYTDDCEFASDLAVSDDARNVHLRCSTGLHILDVSQPSRPVRVGFYAAGGGDRAIALGSGSVFVATDGTVEEVDVRNPRQPTLLNRYQLPAEARRLRMMPGRRLFVFTGTGGMQIIHNTIISIETGGDFTPTKWQGGSSAIALIDGQHDLTIDNNLLAGGSYTVYGPSQHGAAPSNVRVTNNRFSTKYYPKCGAYGTHAGFNKAAPGFVWSGNVWHESGRTVFP